MLRTRLMTVWFAALIVGSWMSVSGAEVSISGTAKDSAGKPLGGVDVSVLSNPAIKAVSGDDGTFRLTGSAPDAAPASPVLAKILANSVTVTGAKDGLMSVRVLAKNASSGVQLTMYPVLKGEVTLTGNLLCSTHAMPTSRPATRERSVFMLAYDGDPGIKAEVDQIMHDYWPEGGSLDGEAARELENQFMERLKYNLDGAQFDAMWKEVSGHAYVRAVSTTGEVHLDAEGKALRSISVSRFGYTDYKYPDKMTVPYKPLVMPSQPPLELKLNDTISIKCIYVPPGKFYMGCPLEQIPHWQEAPQHMVTLTKGYYLAETPLTYEQYAAVTLDVAAGKDNKPDSAAGLSCKMFLNFCKILSARTGKTIRPPTAAEWEYAARVGVSNPSFPSNDPVVEKNAFAPVKATQPNGWGFYQMKVSKSSERTSDASTSEHRDMIDPHYPVKEDSMDPIPDHGPFDHCCKGADDFPIQEMLRSGSGRGVPFESEWNNFAKRERIVVEAERTPAPAAAPGTKPDEIIK